MAAEEADHGLGRLQELLRRAAGAERQGLTIFPFVFGVVRPEAAEDAVLELERVVMLDPLTRGIVVFQGESGLLSELLPSGSSVAAACGPPPASKASIAALKAVEPGEEGEGEDCPVCLDALRSGIGGEAAPRNEVGEGPAAVREMPCRHRFHGGCIEKWLRLHGSCPVCRYQMPAEEEAEPKKVGSTAGGEERGRARQLLVTISFGPFGRGGDEQEQGEE
ncbi:hypothetical protein Cni_G11409 [Canna indica]|uniref:RING-type domain-containing protein n=1 Tax=Canna indica TaxID=4628 RepID=A0AAQ3K817_9LILI|nr:hypothetical protein Cni_G11409 [Canna indica]